MHPFMEALRVRFTTRAMIIISFGLLSTIARAETLAVVTDTAGKEYKVKELTAYYKPFGGVWIGDPSRSVQFISFELIHAPEDRVTTSDFFVVQFSKIREIEFSWPRNRSIPDKSEIKFVDGSIFTTSFEPYISDGKPYFNYTHCTWTEFDSNGIKQRERKGRWCGIVLEQKANGEDVEFKGFSGTAATSSGTVGKFWIDNNEVKSVVFP